MLIGYGEDALTLAIISSHLDRFLASLDDDSDPHDCWTLYRPSFGRGATGRLPGCFGEFDAIVASPKRTYLIESKRTGSKEARRHRLHLSAVQLKRHAVMRAYIEEWNRARPTDWNDFMVRSAIVTRACALGFRVPKAREVLAKNLQFVLRCSELSAGVVQDVVLFLRDLSMHGPATSPPTEANAPGFVVLTAFVGTLREGFTALASPGCAGPDVDFWRSPFIEPLSTG